MSQSVRIRRGLNINLLGEADKVYASVKNHTIYAVKPTDFHGLTPKLSAKVGDKVLAGSVIFFDKYNERIKFCSPVSGTIKDIVRGEKRRILEVIIESDNEQKYESHSPLNVKNANREQLIDHMLSNGVWPFIRQKPYDIIANPSDIPKAIFISAFKSGPLAIDNDFALYGMDDLFQSGIDIITKLTNGKTHLNLDGNTNSSKVFSEAKGVEINSFSGPHPAGNVGVQIHHINPINKGDIVWYLEPQDVIVIARLFNEGKYDVSRIISLCGSEVSKPRYYRTISGTCVSNLIDDNVENDNNRVICGDVLSGTKIDKNGYLGFYDTQPVSYTHLRAHET